MVQSKTSASHREASSGGRVARGIAFAALGGICWGFSGNCAQLLTSTYGIPVAWITCVRMLAAAALFLIVCAFKNWRTLRAAMRDVRSLLFIAGFAILGVLLTQISYLSAIAYTNAGIATVLERFGLVFIMLYVCLRVKRPPKPREALGLVFAMAGVFLIATQGDIGSLSIPFEGLAWGMVSAVALAFYTLMPVKPLAKWGSFIVTGLAMLIGGVASTVAVQPWNLGVVVTPEVVLIMSGLVIVGTFGAYLFYLQGIHDAGSVRASLVGCVEPVSAMVISCVWLGTAITPFDIVGTVFIVIMIFLATQRDEETPDAYSGALDDMPLFEGPAALLGYYRTRRATPDDFNDALAVLETGHAMMAELGINEEDGKRYPSERRVMRAIDHGTLYVVTMDVAALESDADQDRLEHVRAIAGSQGHERIIGLFAVDPAGDPAYTTDALEGEWLRDPDTGKHGDFCALHWVTVIPDARRCGVGCFILGEAARIARGHGKTSLRADTYNENAPMHALLSKQGFSYCGTLILRNSLGVVRRRAAFEKIIR